MHGRKSKGGGPGADGLIHGIRLEEIETDVFELWIGISRLMARVHEPYRPFTSKGRQARRVCQGRQRRTRS